MKPSTRDQLLVLLAQAQWRYYGLWDARDARYYTYLTLWQAIMSLTPRETR